MGKVLVLVPTRELVNQYEQLMGLLLQEGENVVSVTSSTVLLVSLGWFQSLFVLDLQVGRGQFGRGR